MKKFLLFILSILPLLAMGQSKSFDDFKKQQMSGFNQFKSDKQAEFDAFRKKVNDDYAKFMEAAWMPVKTEPAVEPVKPKEVPPVIAKEEPKSVPPPTPTPTPQPVKEDIQPIVSPTQPIETKPIPVKKDIVVVPKPTPAPAPIAPVEPKKEDPVKKVTVRYYGTNISVNFPEDDNFHISALKEKSLAEAWKLLSTEKYNVVVNNVLGMREKLNLCDWAYVLVLQSITEKQYGKSNEAVFMQVYLMTQSGYRVRMAYSQLQAKLYLLIASQYNICSMPYVRENNERFYIMNDKNVNDLHICPAKYEKERSLCMQIGADQHLSLQTTDMRKLTSKRGLTASVCVNKNNIDFFNTYPRAYINGDVTTTWLAYANTPMEKSVRDQLYPLLKKNTQGLSERDAVGLILNWVQTAFEYEYDDKVWGGDRPFFPSETLYYPYCDCEDRAILFSRIVRDVLGLDVVLLYYPGHLASAVAFTQNVNGDYLSYNGRKYTVCDPTYINAGVGMTMPGMNNQQAKIVVLK